MLKDDLSHLVTGPPQPLAKQLDELHRQRRLASHKGNKLATVDNKNLAIGICGGIASPRQAIEHRDFPENLPGTDEIQNRTAALSGGDADLHGAADHRNQAVAGISLGNDRGSPLQRGMFGIAAKLIEGLRVEIAKHWMFAQDS